MDSVTVRVPARLHLGFLDLNGGLGRKYGSLGLALGAPAAALRLSQAVRTSISGPEAVRAGRYLKVMQKALALKTDLRLEIFEAVPAHAGLGSGTNLALGIAAAVRALHGLPFDTAGDALRLGRGARSGIGIGLFEEGGFAVDGGRGAGERAAPVIARVPFPEAWRILLILDHAVEGVHGPQERAAFAGLPQFPAATAAELCHLTLMQVLPALAEADIVSFGAGISAIQRRLGDHFAPAQGGRYTSPRVAAAAAALDALGAHGSGQSSWGPAGFAFAACAGEAQRLKAGLEASGAAAGLDLRIVSGNNRGAVVQPSQTPSSS